MLQSVMFLITCKDVSNFLLHISSVVFGELIYGSICFGDLISLCRRFNLLE